MDSQNAKSLMLFALIAFSGNTHAALYKCVDAAGGTTYQSTPCKAVEKQQQVRVIDSGNGDHGSSTGSAIRPGELDLLKEAELNDAARRKTVMPGMSKEQVKRALGNPIEINHGQYGDSHHEQWIYDEEDSWGRSTTRRKYIYFDDDVVTSKQWETH
jgi:hypothetical protein